MSPGPAATSGLATLPMYDLAEIRSTVDGWWAAISRRLPDAPSALTWDGDIADHWVDPTLILGQTCSWPLVTSLAGRVSVVGAFSYHDLETEPGPVYRSVVVAREDRPLAEFAGRIGAVSSWGSTSGWLSLAHAMAVETDARPVFGEVVVSGGHAHSLAMLRAGTVDVAAIDGVTYQLLATHQPTTVEGLTIVGEGPLIPTLPLITSLPDPAPIREAIRDSVADGTTASLRETLMIGDFFPLDPVDYESVLGMGSLADEVVPRPAGVRR